MASAGSNLHHGMVSAPCAHFGVATGGGFTWGPPPVRVSNSPTTHHAFGGHPTPTEMQDKENDEGVQAS